MLKPTTIAFQLAKKQEIAPHYPFKLWWLKILIRQWWVVGLMIFALSQSKNHWRERESCLLTEQNKSGKAAQSIQEHIKPLPHGFFSILLSHILCLESLVQNTIPGFPHCICEFSGGGEWRTKLALLLARRGFLLWQASILGVVTHDVIHCKNCMCSVSLNLLFYT